MGKNIIFSCLFLVSLFSACSSDVENNTNELIVTATGEQNNPSELIIQEPKDSEVVKELIILQNNYQKIKLSKGVNTKQNEYYPVPNSDGSILFFVGMDRTGQFTAKIDFTTTKSYGGEDIWFSIRENGIYTDAKPLKSLNDNNHQAVTGILNNDLLVYGIYEEAYKVDGSGTDAGFYNGDIFKININTNRLEHLGQPINSIFFESDAYITPDGNTILFVTDRNPVLGSYHQKGWNYNNSFWGNTDIWVSEKVDDYWNEPINLGEVINTEFGERTPYLSSDKKKIYFSSNGHMGYGEQDVFVSDRLDMNSWQSWSKPKNLGEGINGEYNDWGFKVYDNETKAMLASETRLPYKVDARLLGGGNGSIREHNLRNGYKVQGKQSASFNYDCRTDIYYIDMIDLELASEKELLELRALNNDQADDKVQLKKYQNEREALIELSRTQDDIDRKTIARVKAFKKDNADFIEDAKGRIAVQNDNYIQKGEDAKRDLKYRKERIKSIEIIEKRYLTRLQEELVATDIYNNLKLEGDKTYRKKKEKHYNDLLLSFREMNTKQKNQTIKQNDELLTELTWVSEYRAMMDRELSKTGDLLVQAQQNTKDFAKSAKEAGYDVANSARETNKVNIELTILKKLVSNLDAPIVNVTGSLKTMATAFTFSLNKTKDFAKEMSKLIDDLMQDTFGVAMVRATAARDEAVKGAQANLLLIATNIKNIEHFRGKANQKELQDLIKSNKNKYTAIKNLSVDEYKLIIGGKESLDKALKDGVVNQAEYESEIIRLKTLTSNVSKAMLTEEGVKQETNNNYLIQLETSFQEEMRQIGNNAGMKSIADTKKVTDLEIIQEHGRGTAMIRVLKDNGKLRIRTIFGQLRAEKRARDTALKSQTTLIESNLKAQEKILLKYYQDGTLSEEEYQRQLEVVRNAAAIKTGNATQTNLDANVAAQMEALQTISAAYSTAFDAFSTYMNNRWELEKNAINEFRDLESEDLATELEAKLEALEGNEEAQEDVREHYALTQEANDAKRDEALRAVEKKQFMMEKTNKIAQAIINGALAITMISAQTGVVAPFVIPMMTTLIGAQIAAIAATKFTGALGGIIPQFANGGMVEGPSHANGGVKFAVGGRVSELEGGEAVINKRSTAMFRGELSAMNELGGGVKFATGGVTPGTANRLKAAGNGNQKLEFDALAASIVGGINNKTVTVSEVDITGSQHSVSLSELTATIF